MLSALKGLRVKTHRCPHLKRLSPSVSSSLLCRSSYNKRTSAAEETQCMAHGNDELRTRESNLFYVFQPFVQFGVLAAVVSQQVRPPDDVWRVVRPGQSHLSHCTHQRKIIFTFLICGWLHRRKKKTKWCFRIVNVFWPCGNVWSSCQSRWCAPAAV